MASSDEKKAPALDFTALVLSLGSSAIVHLGEAPDPTTGQKRDQPELTMAQQSIDLLAMLQEKTRGNLTAEEARFLENMLFDLRMLFVQVSKRQSAPEKKTLARSPRWTARLRDRDDPVRGPLVLDGTLRDHETILRPGPQPD